MSDEFKTKSSQIRQLASLPPEELVEQLAATHPHVAEVAPGIAPHIHAAAMNAVQFLNDRLPPAGNELAFDAEPKVSSAHKHAWLDLHKTVSDPLSVLEHLEKGTLNRHHIDALQAVYPDLHQEMAQKALEHIGDAKSKGRHISIAKRQALSKFIGQPLDSTMTLQSMQAIINSGGANAAPAGQRHPTNKAISQVDKVSALYQTPLQAQAAKAVQKP